MAGRVEWVHDPARFAAVAEDWEQLARGQESPFADHAWFMAWWEAFGTGRLAVCLLWEGKRLQAALPLSSHRGRLTALANYHTPQFAAPARDLDSLRGAVGESLHSPQGELALHGVAVPGPLHDTLLAVAEPQRRLVLVEQTHRSPLVNIEGDFESFVRARGPRFKDLSRRWRKLNREHEVGFRFGEPTDDLEGELQRGYEVEAAGWKGRRGRPSSPRPVPGSSIRPWRGPFTPGASFG